MHTHAHVSCATSRVATVRAVELATVQVGSEDDGSHARVARAPLASTGPALESLLDEEVAHYVLRRGEVFIFMLL